MTKRRFLLVLLTFLVAPLAHADMVLQTYFDQLKSFSAHFEQEVLNPQLGGANKASGTLYIKRPGRFRWDYTEPYDQQIVSDGKKIWIYDADLEQVTVKSVSTGLKGTPALLLSDDQPIEQSFQVTTVMSEDDLEWFLLTPRVQDTSFSEIRLGFSDKGQLLRMTLIDNLGQTTKLRFSQVKRNINIPDDKFRFVPPKGVDVFISE